MTVLVTRSTPGGVAFALLPPDAMDGEDLAWFELARVNALRFAWRIVRHAVTGRRGRVDALGTTR